MPQTSPDADSVIDTLIAALDRPDLPADRRAEIGDALARAGDPRAGVGVRGGLPDVDWVTIPAGAFVMGSNPARDPAAQAVELPAHKLELPGYRISRTPVTRVQFAVFVESGGHGERVHWTDVGWKARTSADSAALRTDDGNCPVVGVSWHEASAFCRWLSAERGDEVRLPSEAEWEKAARGTDGRRYPWGDSADSARCNVRETGLGRACAVGLFPAGASPHGVMDMSGSTFEWTSSLFRAYPYDQADGCEDASAAGSRVFRGGAFGFDLTLARCAYRTQFYPFARYDWLGFRICTSWPLP